MFNRNDVHIATAIYVLNFRDVDTAVRFQQAAAEKAFEGIVNGQSDQSNVPDSFDPAMPRILFHSGTKQLAISQASCQLTLNFPEVGKLTFDKQWDVIEKNVRDFYSKAMGFKPDTSYGMCSLVLQMVFRSDASTSDLNAWLYDKLVKKGLAGELASVSVAIGYKRDLWYLNINIAAYERREFNIPTVTGQQFVQLKLDKLPVTERGINLTIDVNNRPKFQLDDSAPGDIPETILKLARDFSTEQMGTIIDELGDAA